MWDLTADDLNYVAREATTHLDMYALVAERSPTLRAIPNVRVLDKTPTAYFTQLDDVMRRAPGVPVILMGGESNPSVERAKADPTLRRRIYRAHIHELRADPHVVMSGIFGFLGLHWERSYLNMTGFRSQLNLSHSECITEHIARLFTFKVGQHTPGSRGNENPNASKCNS